MDTLIDEAGRGEYRCQPLHRLCRTPRFFLELPDCAGFGSLASVQAPGRDLEQVSVCSVAVLSQQQDLRIVSSRIAQKGHDRARPGVPDDLEVRLGSIRKAYSVHVQAPNVSRRRPPRAD